MWSGPGNLRCALLRHLRRLGVERRRQHHSRRFGERRPRGGLGRVDSPAQRGVCRLQRTLLAAVPGPRDPAAGRRMATGSVGLLQVRGAAERVGIRVRGSALRSGTVQRVAPRPGRGAASTPGRIRPTPSAALCSPQGRVGCTRFCTTHITTSGDLSSSNGLPHNVNQLNAVLKELEAYRAEGATVIIAGDFNAQPSYRRLDNWYSGELDVPANQDNAGSYRELDDNDSAHCRGFGEWTAAGAPGALPPCAGSESRCTVATADGCGKIDLIFVREDRIVGDYTSDSLAISSSCGWSRERPGEYPAGSCSDHRIVTGTVRVLTGPYQSSREALSGPALNSPLSTPGAARRTRSRRSARPRRAATPARAARGASGCRPDRRRPASTTAATRMIRLSSIEW